MPPVNNASLPPFPWSQLSVKPNANFLQHLRGIGTATRKANYTAWLSFPYNKNGRELQILLGIIYNPLSCNKLL